MIPLKQKLHTIGPGLIKTHHSFLLLSFPMMKTPCLTLYATAAPSSGQRPAASPPACQSGARPGGCLETRPDGHVTPRQAEDAKTQS